MTKAKFLALVKKQGAEYDIYGDSDSFTCDVWLPEHLIWDNGHGNGLASQEFDRHQETLSQFWDEFYRHIDYPVIEKPND